MTKMYKTQQSDSGKEDIILELWGISTKHPDSRFRFSDFEKSDVCDEFNPFQIYQWVLKCASELRIPYQSVALVHEATERLRNWVFEQDGSERGWEMLCAGL